ncbi:MAG: hypothetical protein GC203_11805 [Phenylobacterium sp.]|uniref:hypothetical protein n=1 Tax=Phenylobacterium sp. TaxID=1871053 RepID=UPI0025D1A1B6|nr:hypothetical protein [Phenylobacterium sp.]MBI1198538.1 hypothetical protein [Phenylobacterium sp.]
MIPVVGSLAGFAIDQLPARRMNRVVTYLHLLHERVAAMAADLNTLRQQWDQRPEASGLFEAGISAAAEATSDPRMERLASVVASGLTANEVTAMNAARRIRLLREMDDGEFALLVIVERERRITLRYADDYGWLDDNTVTFISAGGEQPPPALPAELADWSTSDLSTALNHLAGLGVIEANLAQHSKEHGAIRSYVATPAGQELVRIVSGEPA